MPSSVAALSPLLLLSPSEAAAATWPEAGVAGAAGGVSAAGGEAEAAAAPSEAAGVEVGWSWAGVAAVGVPVSVAAGWIAEAEVEAGPEPSTESVTCTPHRGVEVRGCAGPARRQNEDPWIGLREAGTSRKIPWWELWRASTGRRRWANSSEDGRIW